MLTVGLSLLLVDLGVSVGLGLPLIGAHRAMEDRRELALAEELHRQREVIADYEATIHAYRLYAQNDPELSEASR